MKSMYGYEKCYRPALRMYAVSQSPLVVEWVHILEAVLTPRLWRTRSTLGENTTRAGRIISRRIPTEIGVATTDLSVNRSTAVHTIRLFLKHDIIHLSRGVPCFFLDATNADGTSARNVRMNSNMSPSNAPPPRAHPPLELGYLGLDKAEVLTGGLVLLRLGVLKKYTNQK